jgi:hypothetical protein
MLCLTNDIDMISEQHEVKASFVLVFRPERAFYPILEAYCSTSSLSFASLAVEPGLISICFVFPASTWVLIDSYLALAGARPCISIPCPEPHLIGHAPLASLQFALRFRLCGVTL